MYSFYTTEVLSPYMAYIYNTYLYIQFILYNLLFICFSSDHVLSGERSCPKRTRRATCSNILLTPLIWPRPSLRCPHSLVSWSLCSEL